MTYYIEIYTKKNCPYCEKAKQLLTQKSLNFIDIPIDDDKACKNNPFRLEMYKRSGRKSVPQIFINKIHIGGLDDLLIYNKQGKLDCLTI